MKKILIMSKRLNSGGVEVSLINLLNQLSLNSNLKLVLFLEKYQGVYTKDIPSNVEIREIKFKKNYYNFLLNFNEAKKVLKKLELIIYLIIKIMNKLSFIIFKYNKVGRYIIKNKTDKINDKYDLAIDFHGYGYDLSPYLIYNINSKKKILFVHDENIKWMERIKDILPHYDKIFCVSNSCAKNVKEKYEEISEKVDVCHNLINMDKIIKESEEPVKIHMDGNKFKILTIGRLEYQKGYDILIQIAKLLEDMRIDYVWYVIGTGSLYNDILKWIKNHKLEDKVILLGIKKNPYPYIKKCDIYVQPSRHEGYGLAIAEARYLEKPIIATNLECIKEQIISGYNGILCDLEPKNFAEQIKKLYEDEKLRINIKSNLKLNNESFNNDIKKIYDLL